MRQMSRLRAVAQKFSFATRQYGTSKVESIKRSLPVAIIGLRKRQSENTQQQCKKKIPIYPSPPSASSVCKNPITVLDDTQIKILDPTCARTRLFARSNPEAAKVGDILLVRRRSGEPFAGVCLSIRRRGVDTSVLLRNRLTRVGVEMWYKIYSPNVDGIEVVRRRQKRARRARLYYMRHPRHDMGSVENIVKQYERERAALGTTKRRNADTGAQNRYRSQ